MVIFFINGLAKDHMRLLNISFMAFFLLFTSCTLQKKQKPTILDRQVTMKFYSAENLESVINRLHVETGQVIVFNTTMLLPYQAKAADYKKVTVRSILEEQLKGTPLDYRPVRNKLVIGLKDDGNGKR